MSDHCVLKFGCSLYAEHCRIQQKFRLNKGDYDNLCDFLNLDWDAFLDYANSSVDEMREKFKLLLMDGINKFIPVTGQHPQNYKRRISSHSALFSTSKTSIMEWNR